MGCRSCTSIPNIDTFAYNDFGELTSAKVNGVTSTYTYRADGLRWYKTVNGTVTRHLWDGDDVIMDMTDGYGIVNKYTRGLGLIRYTDGTNTRYYTRNRHGDTNHMIDAATYSIANTYKYDAYGNQESISSTDTNPFRYSGEYYDSETGFIYLRARYYDSTIGSFISEDPARDGINWYAYCAGNPLNFIDPLGLAPFDLFSTRDEAAADFGKYIGAKSIEDEEEYAAAIYVTTDENGDVWYYYDEPRNDETPENRNDSFEISWNCKDGETVMAIVHTHGAISYDYDENGNGSWNYRNNFSTNGNTRNPDAISDTKASDGIDLDYYLVTPTGELKVYYHDSGNYSGKTIRTDMPVDPTYETLLWWIEQIGEIPPPIELPPIIPPPIKLPPISLPPPKPPLIPPIEDIIPISIDYNSK